MKYMSADVGTLATIEDRASRIDARFWLTRSRVGLPSSAGFTLIEMMIVVVIIAVLAAIAFPVYTTYVTKTHRVAAEGCLSEAANYMERYYTTNLSYKSGAAGPNTLPTFSCATSQQTGSYYRYVLPTSALTVSTYQIEAVPIGSQLTNDTKCGTLTLDQTGARTPGATTQCW